MQKKLIELLNDQINKEMYSAYLYLGISDYYKRAGLAGFASWFKKQAEEEFEHAEKIIEYMDDVDVPYNFGEIKGVQNEFKDFKEPLLLQVNHEKYVTGLILNLYETARNYNDVATKLFLEWFVNEQVEEEKNARELLETYEFIKDDKAALFSFNKSLGERK